MIKTKVAQYLANLNVASMYHDCTKKIIFLDKTNEIKNKLIFLRYWLKLTDITPIHKNNILQTKNI